LGTALGQAIQIDVLLGCRPKSNLRGTKRDVFLGIEILLRGECQHVGWMNGTIADLAVGGGGDGAEACA